MNLPNEFRQTLAELEMLSHGAVTGYNKSGGGKDSEHPGGKQPQGESSPPHIIYRERWIFGRSEAHRIRIEQEAADELRAIKVRTTMRIANVKTDRELVLEDGKGYSPGQVAQHYGYSETTVRKWRRDLGLDPETGDEFKERDGSVREIGRRLGISKSAAHRLKHQGESQRTKIERMFGKKAA